MTLMGLRDSLRIALINARITSLAYLAIASILELARRLGGFRWAEVGTRAIEELPATLLGWLQLKGPLRTAFDNGSIGSVGVRATGALVTIAFIYLLAIAVGLLVGAVAMAVERRRNHGASPPVE